MIRVLILGYGPMGLALTKGVLACQPFCQIVGVFPWSMQGEQKKQQWETGENHFLHFVSYNNIPLIEAKSVNHYDFARLLKTLRPDVVLVGSWGEIFKPHVLDTPNIQFINCHPSLLPHHRGANPYTSVILSSEPLSGVTFHLIDDGVDTGPILLQAELIVEPTDTGDSLRQRCAALAEKTVIQLMTQMAQGELTPVPQPPGGSYYALDPALSWIQWSHPPEQIERVARAHYPWSYAYARLGRMTLACESIWQTPAINPNPAQAPGTILACTATEITVSSSDPSIGLILNRPVICGIPHGINAIARFFILKPGMRFTQDVHS